MINIQSATFVLMVIVIIMALPYYFDTSSKLGLIRNVFQWDSAYPELTVRAQLVSILSIGNFISASGTML